MGMAKKRSLPFEDAREFIQSECIGSRKQYTEWHKTNKPKQIPRYPNRAYEEEWKGWNDFLGTNNSFDNKKRKYRPLAEAIAWVHTLNLPKQHEWLKYCTENRDTMPKDIPTRPDLVYDDWLSWMHWLGNKPRQKVEAQQQVVRSSTVFYVIQEKEYADHTTIFTFGLEKGGVSGMRDWWQLTKNFKIVQMFEYDETEMANVQQAIERNSTAYWGAEKVRIAVNINQLLYEIGNHLMIAQIR